MFIRPTIAGDFPAIAALTNEFIVGTAVHFAFEPVTADEMSRQWMETRERYPWLIAEIDGRFAGYAKAGPWRARAAYQWTAEAGIYMTAESRGGGRGRQLYAALIAALRTRGFHSVIGGMTLPNEASQRLHASLGFTRIGVFREAGHKLGEWHDVAFYQLMLQEGCHEPG